MVESKGVSRNGELRQPRCTSLTRAEFLFAEKRSVRIYNGSILESHGKIFYKMKKEEY